MSITKDIIKAMGRRQVLRNHTPVVANITTIFDWEVDLFSVNPGGMMYEFEVKISRTDFLKDKKKKKWGYMAWKAETKTPNYMSYVCPEGLIKTEEIPDFAGLFYYVNGEIAQIKAPSQRHKAIRNINEIQMKVARMYSQREFLGRTLISHLNKEIRERNAERERIRKEQQERFMKMWRDKKLNSEPTVQECDATDDDSSTEAGNPIK